jgi:hypothetical protein
LISVHRCNSYTTKPKLFMSIFFGSPAPLFAGRLLAQL